MKEVAERAQNQKPERTSEISKARSAFDDPLFKKKGPFLLLFYFIFFWSVFFWGRVLLCLPSHKPAMQE
jgi:hypothetical protein